MISLPDEAALESWSDEELAQAAREGCEEAFTRLVYRHTPMIQRQAARYRRDTLEAEDLAQEGLLGLLAAVRTFRPDGGAQFSTYASICVRNRMVSALRRIDTAAPVLSTVEENGWEGQEPVDGQADPEQRVLDREAMDHLREKLKNLLTSLEYQVLMQYLSAYTYEEIADSLQVGVKAVDNALQRVRRKLSAHFWEGLVSRP